jgi:hypothetical protein
MQRREFIAFVAGIATFPLVALVLWPAKIWRADFTGRIYEQLFDQVFRSLCGFVCNECQDVIVDGHVERFQYIAAEMVTPKVSVSIIVAFPAAVTTVAVPQRHAWLSQIANPTEAS